MQKHAAVAFGTSWPSGRLQRHEAYKDFDRNNLISISRRKGERCLIFFPPDGFVAHLSLACGSYLKLSSSQLNPESLPIVASNNISISVNVDRAEV